MLARWAARSQGSFASLELAAPDICIPPRRARSALPTGPLRSALRLVRNAVSTTPAPQDSPGPGGTPGHPHPEPPFVYPPHRTTLPYSPGLHASLPPEAARCPIPRTLRRPPRVQCGAPPARGPSRERSRRRRARAQREGRAGRWGARATPTRAQPRGSQDQSACTGGAEPSAGRLHWPGARRPTQGPALRPSLETQAEVRGAQVAEKGGLGTCPGSRFPRSIHGDLFAQVAGPFLSATLCSALAAQLTSASSYATRPEQR